MKTGNAGSKAFAAWGQRLHRLWADRRGASFALFAAALPLVLGTAGLAVETGVWFRAKRYWQTAADDAATAGALERLRGNPALVADAGSQELQRYGLEPTVADTAVHNPPLTGAYTGDPAAVEVQFTRPQQLLFASAFLAEEVQLALRAVARIQTSGSACTLALHPTASAAISSQGNPTVYMPGCAIGSNSSNANSIDFGGNSIVTAETLWSAGGFNYGGSTQFNLAQAPLLNMWPLPDPYESLAVLPFGACDHTNMSIGSGTVTINPGVYCGGLTIGSSAHVTLNPGVYYIDSGDIRINAGAIVDCNCVSASDGVTFVLTSSVSSSAIGSITINGGADVTLRAPSDDSAPYKGILLFQDRAATPGVVNKLNGGSSMDLTGAVYFPNQNIEWSGNNDSSFGSRCALIIGQTIKFTGNSVIRNDGCEKAGVEPVTIKAVRLVE